MSYVRVALLSGWAAVRSPLVVKGHRFFLVSLEILLAATLAILFLGEKSFWLDEAFSVVAVARLDWTSMWQVLSDREANGGLYFVLLHLWLVLGESEFAVRSLSVVFAVATVPVVYALGSRLFGLRVAAGAALLLAVNAFFIQYAQEARGYSLLLFLASLSSYILVRAIEKPSWWTWIAYILISVLAVYAHVFAVLVLGAQAISIVFLDRRYVPWRALTVAGFTILLLLVPLGIFFLTQDSGQIDWIRQPSFGSLYELFYALTGRGGGLLLLAYLIPVAFAFLFAIRSWFRFKISPETWRYALLLSWLFVPIIIAFSLSFLKPVFIPRYFIICLVPLTLLAAVGLSQIRNRWIFVSVLAILVILSARGVGAWYSSYEKEDWRGATTHVISRFERGDAILFHASYVRVPFEYYLDRLAAPSEIVESIGVARVAGADRVWLVLSHDSYSHVGRVQSRSIQASLQNRYALVEQREFKEIKVLLYE